MAYNRANGRGAQRQNFNNRTNNRTNNRGTFRDVLREKNPEGFDVASFIRNSASLRRHVGLGVKHQVIANGIAQPADSIYVKFGLTHFTVRINGLGTDYNYSDMMLLKALLASCISTSTQIQNLVNALCCAQWNEPASEIKDLNSAEGAAAIQDIASAVLAHIDEQVDEKD